MSDQTRMLLGLAARRSFTLLGAWLASKGLIHGDPSGFVGACMIIAEVGYEGWNRYGTVLVNGELAKMRGVHPSQVLANSPGLRGGGAVGGVVALVIAVAAIALLPVRPAFAGDIAPKPVFVTKAPPPQISNVYPTKGCGAFYGLAAEGSNGIVNGAPAGTVQIGGDIGGLVGWACPTAGVPWFAQFKAEFQNLNAGNAGFAMKGPAHLEEMFAIQTPLLQWFVQWINVGQNNIPALQGLLPPGVTPTGTPQNYIAFVVDQDDISESYGNAANHNWINSYGPRTGILTNLLGPNGTQAVSDTFVQLNFQSTPIGCIGPAGAMACPKLGDSIRMGWEVKM